MEKAKRKMIEVSANQILLFKIVRDAHPTARLNYPIRTPYTTVYADIALPGRKIDVEYDVEYWHRPRALRDRARDAALRLMGWRTIRTKEVSEGILELIGR